jgi:argininosuccinate lyase
MSAASSLLTTQSKMAEDLEIWASTEFDYVSIADGYSRSSVLMPQKRNPYSLSIIRGASGTLIGRLSGFLAVSKSPSARSDNLIYAYGEVPRALDLALRTTRLTAGVIATLEVNSARMWQALESGFSQSTDLAEFIMRKCAVDYRTAYQIVGTAVRKASRDGIRGVDLTVSRLQDAAEYHDTRLDLDDIDLAAVLDPRGIVETRVLAGGAAPQVVADMAERCREQGERLLGEAGRRRAAMRTAENDLVKLATMLLAEETEGDRR